MIKRTISYICTVALLVWVISVTGTIVSAENEDGYVDTETVQDAQEEDTDIIVLKPIPIDTDNSEKKVTENTPDGNNASGEHENAERAENDTNAEKPGETEDPAWLQEEDYGGTEANNPADEMINGEISEETGSETAAMSEDKQLYNLTFLTTQEGGEVIKTIQVEAGTVCAEAEGFIPGKGTNGDPGVNYQWRMVGKTSIVSKGRLMPEEDLVVYVYPASEAKNWVKEEKDGKITWTYSASENSDPLLVIESDGHNWDQGTVTKEPTCTETGTKLYTCTDEDCNETRTETIPANGHTEQKADDKPAGCTEAGYTGETVCSVCGVTIAAKTNIEATGHSDNDNDGICDTCGERIYGLNADADSTSYTLKSNKNISPLKVNLGVKDAVVPGDLKVSLRRDTVSRDLDNGELLVKDTDYTVALSSDGYYWDVTLLPARLETLDAGEYIVSIQWDFDNGTTKTAEGRLTVLPAEEGPKNPGSNNSPLSGNNGRNSSTGGGGSGASAEITITSIASVSSNAPKTGDETDIVPWLILALLSGIGFVIVCASGKKHHSK